MPNLVISYVEYALRNHRGRSLKMAIKCQVHFEESSLFEFKGMYFICCEFGEKPIQLETRSSWLNCALRDDEAVYCVSKGHYEAVAVDN